MSLPTTASIISCSFEALSNITGKFWDNSSISFVLGRLKRIRDDLCLPKFCAVSVFVEDADVLIKVVCDA